MCGCNLLGSHVVARSLVAGLRWLNQLTSFDFVFSLLVGLLYPTILANPIIGLLALLQIVKRYFDLI